MAILKDLSVSGSTTINGDLEVVGKGSIKISDDYDTTELKGSGIKIDSDYLALEMGNGTEGHGVFASNKDGKESKITPTEVTVSNDNGEGDNYQSATMNYREIITRLGTSGNDYSSMTHNEIKENGVSLKDKYVNKDDGTFWGYRISPPQNFCGNIPAEAFQGDIDEEDWNKGIVIAQNQYESAGIYMDGNGISLWCPPDSWSLAFFNEDNNNSIPAWQMDRNGIMKGGIINNINYKYISTMINNTITQNSNSSNSSANFTSCIQLSDSNSHGLKIAYGRAKKVGWSDTISYGTTFSYPPIVFLQHGGNSPDNGTLAVNNVTTTSFLACAMNDIGWENDIYYNWIAIGREI